MRALRFRPQLSSSLSAVVSSQVSLGSSQISHRRSSWKAEALLSHTWIQRTRLSTFHPPRALRYNLAVRLKSPPW